MRGFEPVSCGDGSYRSANRALNTNLYATFCVYLLFLLYKTQRDNYLNNPFWNYLIGTDGPLRGTGKRGSSTTIPFPSNQLALC